jgi:hypothetical protein
MDLIGNPINDPQSQNKIRTGLEHNRARIMHHPVQPYRPSAAPSGQYDV